MGESGDSVRIGWSIGPWSIGVPWVVGHPRYRHCPPWSNASPPLLHCGSPWWPAQPAPKIHHKREIPLLKGPSLSAPELLTKGFCWTMTFYPSFFTFLLCCIGSTWNMSSWWFPSDIFVQISLQFPIKQISLKASALPPQLDICPVVRFNCEGYEGEDNEAGLYLLVMWPLPRDSSALGTCLVWPSPIWWRLSLSW